jgi:LPS-assembly lipoprotein
MGTSIRSGLAGLICLLPVLSVLTACGFEPLYGRGGGEEKSAVNEDLSQVLVLPIPHRTGQQMHNFLRDRLNPAGQPNQPEYTLSVVLNERITELGIQEDATATRAQLTMVADYTLRDYDNQEVLFLGKARSANSYDILGDPYATQVAEFDARELTLRAISEEMKIRLATYFKRERE